MATITAANAVLMLSVPGVFSTPQRIQGFATDDAFASNAPDRAEVMMGVDGVLSAGFIPATSEMVVMLQADSASRAFFDAWNQAQKTAREIRFGSGTIRLASIGRVFTLTRGVLKSTPDFPGVKKVLQPTAHTIIWQDISGAPI